MGILCIFSFQVKLGYQPFKELTSHVSGKFLERLITQFHLKREDTKDRQRKIREKASSGYSVIQEVNPRKPKTLLQKANPAHNHTRRSSEFCLQFPAMAKLLEILWFCHARVLR